MNILDRPGFKAFKHSPSFRHVEADFAELERGHLLKVRFVVFRL